MIKWQTNTLTVFSITVTDVPTPSSLIKVESFPFRYGDAKQLLGLFGLRVRKFGLFEGADGQAEPTTSTLQAGLLDQRRKRTRDGFLRHIRRTGVGGSAAGAGCKYGWTIRTLIARFGLPMADRSGRTMRFKDQGFSTWFYELGQKFYRRSTVRKDFQNKGGQRWFIPLDHTIARTVPLMSSWTSMLKLQTSATHCSSWAMLYHRAICCQSVIFISKQTDTSLRYKLIFY